MDNVFHRAGAQIWEFASSGGAGLPVRWTWRCRRAGDGSLLASASQSFPSIKAAIEDATTHGFVYTGTLPG